MSERTDNQDRVGAAPEGPRQGLRGGDALAVLAISAFMAAIALVTFVLTSALAR